MDFRFAVNSAQETLQETEKNDKITVFNTIEEFNQMMQKGRNVSDWHYYRAILDSHQFNNAKFWQGIFDYENGLLEPLVLDLHLNATYFDDHLVPWSMKNFRAHSLSLPLAELIYNLSGNRLKKYPNPEVIENTLRQIILDSCLDHPQGSFDHYWVKGSVYDLYKQYGGLSTNILSLDTSYRKKPPVQYIHNDIRKEMIGHPNFIVPELEQTPISNDFWLSMLFMTAGIAAIVVAFAFLQAAALTISGVAAVALGSGCLMAGLGLFAKDRRNVADFNHKVEQDTLGWIPLPR